MEGTSPVHYSMNNRRTAKARKVSELLITNFLRWFKVLFATSNGQFGHSKP
jgi:hypothetical protein